ncbi:MAG TPA: efflux RND transporter periplasmic adaptor subunit [Pyrinomonadaceae bacterium]
MSENNQKDSDEQVIEKTTTVTERGGATNETGVTQVRHSPPRRGNKVAVVAIGAIVAMIGIAFVAWLLWPSKAGRPVPAPRSISVSEPAGPETASAVEQKVTLTTEQLQRAGIKIETVGEKAAPEMASQTATGVIQANAYHETPVMSLVSGIVRSVRVELGQNVGRGQTLAVVSSNELAEAQSRYITALAELDEHHKHHRRTAKLVEIGAASREEFEMATTKLKTAESELANLRQKLLLLGLSSQRVNGLNLSSQVSSEVSVPSPASGTVTSRTANPGEVIEANKELLRVTDLSSVWAVGQVYEKDLGRVHVGSGASVTSDAYPGRIFRGRVSYVDPKVDPATRTAQVRIELGNPGQVLKIGMFVNIAFATIGGAENTLPVVPVSAVQNINNQQTVFVGTSDANVFVLRPVRLGPESNGLYSVLEGLTVGERIVTEGSFLLRAEWLKSHSGK